MQDHDILWSNPLIWIPHVPTVDDTVFISFNDSFNEGDQFHIEGFGVIFKDLIVESSHAKVNLSLTIDNSAENININISSIYLHFYNFF